MPFFSGLSLGGGLGGDNAGAPPQGYDAFLQQLLRQFPGLSQMQAGAGAPQTTGSLGFASPGVNLYSGQAASGGGLYGATGTGLFEGASAGQPESITGGLAAGSLGKSPSQAPLPNTGQPLSSAPTSPALGGSGPFANLGAAGLTANPMLDQFARADASNLLGAPPQQYDLLGPVSKVIGAVQGGVQQARNQSMAPTAAPGVDLSGFAAVPGGPTQGIPGEFVGSDLNNPEFGTLSGQNPMVSAPFGTEGGGSGGGPPIGTSPLGDLFGSLGQHANTIGHGLGVLGGVGQLLGGVQQGNPLSATLGGLQAANNASALFGGPTVGSLLSSVLPQTATEAAISSAGGIGEAGAIASGAIDAASAGAGALAGIVATPFTMALTNWLAGIGPPSGKLHETNAIRRDFGTAWPQLQGGAEAFQALQGVDRLPAAQQVPALQQILRQVQQALGAGAAVSQFLSTQGGRHGAQSSEGLGLGSAPGVEALDVSPYEQVSGQLVTMAQLARYAAEDALRARGVDPGGQFNTSTEADVRGLARMAGSPYNVGETGIAGQYTDPWGQTIDIQRPTGQAYAVDRLTGANPNAPLANYNLSPEEIAGIQSVPNRTRAMLALLQRLSPTYAQSLVGGIAGELPAFAR